jgi:Tfp pilus assembly protein PilF
MRWTWLILLGLAGCFSPREERVHEYNADGVFLFQQGAYPQARETFEAALALKPNDAGLLYNLGECHHRQAAFADAERYYYRCLEREPNHAPCRFALAHLLIQTGRSDDARRLIDDWLQQQPGRADPYALDGWFWHVTGDLPRAQARLQQALELEPHNQRALLELGLVYEAMQRADRAVALYQRALAEDPRQPEVKRRVDGLLTRGVGNPLLD